MDREVKLNVNDALRYVLHLHRVASILELTTSRLRANTVHYNYIKQLSNGIVLC